MESKRVKFVGVNSIKFNKQFKDDDESCYGYLAVLKWDNGFTCKKCGAINIAKASGLFPDALQGVAMMKAPPPGRCLTNASFPVNCFPKEEREVIAGIIERV